MTITTNDGTFEENKEKRLISFGDRFFFLSVWGHYLTFEQTSNLWSFLIGHIGL